MQQPCARSPSRPTCMFLFWLIAANFSVCWCKCLVLPVTALQEWCVAHQVALPAEIRQFVQASTGNYGKVKLVLQRNAFFVESPFPDVLHTLLQARQLCPMLTAVYCFANLKADSPLWHCLRRTCVVQRVVLNEVCSQEGHAQQ